MNERIKALAIEANLYVDFNGEPWPRNMIGEDIEGAYQKFAELIVRDIHAYVDSMDTAQIISCGILKRYGVEE